MNLFGNIYKGKKVLLTGHTGFKGSWLAFWLKELGAEVIGYSNSIPTQPNHFELTRQNIISVMGDINDKKNLAKVFADFQPEIVFHLAAQSLVRYSYSNPVETFETNVIGTVNIFEVARHCKSVRAIVNITSDKCYENLETDVAYKETDRFGGYDPYSASKGCAELVVNSYRNSFFNIDKYQSTHHILLASARAGNVIGGGDWSADRLIPDVVKASAVNKPVTIRSPRAIRPWQHVLEPLSGYLLLGQLLLEGKEEIADGWNFGPENNEALSVEEVLTQMKHGWPNIQYNIEQNPSNPHEASLLRLDCTKANTKINWYPVWNTAVGVSKTVNWYKNFYGNGHLSTREDLASYIEDAKAKKIIWSL